MFDNIREKVLEIAFKEISKKDYIETKKKENKICNSIMMFIGACIIVFSFYISDKFVNDVSVYSIIMAFFSLIILCLGASFLAFSFCNLLILPIIENQDLKYEDEKMKETQLNLEELKLFNSFFDEVKADLTNDEFQSMLKKVKDETGTTIGNAYFISYLSENYDSLKEDIRSELRDEELENNIVDQFIEKQFKK